MKPINYRGTPEEARRTSSGKAWPLGTRMHVSNERVFRYARAGSSALIAGQLIQVAERDSFVADVAYVSSTRDVDSITLTIATPARISQDEYADGIAYVNDGPNQGTFFTIVTQPEVEPSTTTIKIYFDENLTIPMQAAFTTSSKFTLIRNKYNRLVRAQSSSETVVGVPVVNVSANEYFWCQVSGPTAILQDGTLIVNGPIASSLRIPGACGIARISVPAQELTNTGEGFGLVTVLDDDGAGFVDKQVPITGSSIVIPITIGYAIDPRDDTDYALINLTLDN